MIGIGAGLAFENRNVNKKLHGNMMAETIAAVTSLVAIVFSPSPALPALNTASTATTPRRKQYNVVSRCGWP